MGKDLVYRGTFLVMDLHNEAHTSETAVICTSEQTPVKHNTVNKWFYEVRICLKKE